MVAHQFGTLAVPAMALCGLGALIWIGARLRLTTLIAPWFWSMLAWISIAGCEVFAPVERLEGSASWASPLRFAAAMTVFCPTMAMLGAKRPQSRAWQFIVLSLWVILCLPSAEWLLFEGGAPREIHPLRAVFFGILIIVGLVNYLPTRFWAASILFALAQILFISPFIAVLAEVFPSPQGGRAGLACSTLAILLSAWLLARRRRSHPPLDRLWLDFRDLYGAVWALRVQERVGAAAQMHGWVVILRWSGFRPANPKEQAAAPTELTENFKSLLRRFVDERWIAERIAEL